ALPTDTVGVDESPHDTEKADAEQDDSGIIQARGFRVARLADGRQGERDQSGAQRQIDVKRPSPSEIGRDEASEDWTERRRYAHHSAPDRIGASALMGFESLGDDGERRRELQRGADSLQR